MNNNKMSNVAENKVATFKYVLSLTLFYSRSSIVASKPMFSSASVRFWLVVYVC